MNRGKNLIAGSLVGNRRRVTQQRAGYTIVEVLIFLAVSGAMFIAMTGLISGRQAKTEFSNATREFELKVTDAANDVANGFYPAVACTADPSDSGRPAPDLSPIADVNSQGTNSQCMGVGKVLHFAPSGNRETYNTYSMVARRIVQGGNCAGAAGVRCNIRNNFVAKGNPVIIASNSFDADAPNLFDTTQFGSGATVEWVRTSVNADFTSNYTIHSFAVMSRSQQIAVGGVVGADSSQSLTYDVIVPANTTGVWGRNGNQSSSAFAQDFRNRSSSGPGLDEIIGGIGRQTIVRNPAGGVRICIQSGGTNQRAIVQLGGNNGNNAASSAVIEAGRCSSI